tara:strand:- start:3068 stop:3688 length:621 start_codon:yes stop_codon:yes gene_type:complete
MNNKSICLLDYGSGNVKSVYNILDFLGYDVKISNNSRDIIDSTHIILPGVGAFGTSMKKIMDQIPFDVLENEVINKGKPFLGICVGMQVLADKGFEFGEHRGFGWISGVVKKINTEDLPTLHIGWNDLIIKKESPLLKGVDIINDFYFVHSFIFDVESENSTLAETNYGYNFTSVLSKDNIYGVQFHPEKSQKAGQLIFKNFMDIS